MADCRITVADKLENLLIGLEQDLPELQEKMLKEMAKTALPVAKSNLSSSIGATKYPSRSTGELQGALGISPVKPSLSGGGSNIAIGFSEPRRHQTMPKGYHPRVSLSRGGRLGDPVADRGYYTATNALLASLLEHGKSGQPARPFMTPAKHATRDACIERAKQVFEAEVRKYQ